MQKSFQRRDILHQGRQESSAVSQAKAKVPCAAFEALYLHNMNLLTCSFDHLQYSFSLTTFSPSGKLVQIEYALNAVNGGSTSLGIKATNGVVIATEKKLRSTLIDETTVQKISLLTPNIGVAYSGMGPDSRLLVRKARKSAQVGYNCSINLTGLLL